jgi:hypothetical protein
MRALLSDDTHWDLTYSPTFAAPGISVYAASSAYAASISKYVILQGTYPDGSAMWRYIEP